MTNPFAYFKSLHESTDPLLIANVWNAQSARVFQKLHFKAIATSSAAVAESLGYADGQQMSFEEYFAAISHIIHSAKLPLSVDLEAGYGDTPEMVVKNIRQLAMAGVIGINIEDSIVQNGKRSLIDAERFAHRLDKISNALRLHKVEIFINVRCDAFLLNVPSPIEEASKRILLYQKSGIHGFFFPCITSIDDIETIVQSTSFPVNVMAMPGLPNFDQLKKVGVKRISMGNSVNQFLYSELEKIGKKIMDDGSFKFIY
jgi:2-methylisocitrate lyase-like PEP mutase family enzyme